jgi:hypothetical protein
MGRVSRLLPQSFFEIIFFIALLLVVPLAKASISDPIPAGLCDLYMSEEIPFDALMPEVGPSLVELFPTSILNSNETVVLMLKDKAESSERAESSPLDDLDAVLRYSETLKAKNWRWRKVQVGVRGLRDFSSQAPDDQYLVFTSPLTVLPREWQLRLLKRISRSSDFERQSLETLRRRAENSHFSIVGQEPVQVEPSASRILEPHFVGFVSDQFSVNRRSVPYVGNLDPEPKLGAILSLMREHYFGSEFPLDEKHLRDIYRRHIFFRLAP